MRRDDESDGVGETEVFPEHLLAPRHPCLPVAQQLHRPVALRSNAFPPVHPGVSQSFAINHRPQLRRPRRAQLRRTHVPGPVIERRLRARVHPAELLGVAPGDRVHRRGRGLRVELPEEFVQSLVFLYVFVPRIRGLQVA